MVAQVAAILILILGQGHLRGFFVLGQVALWVATVSAIVSAVDYSRRINVIMAARPSPPAEEAGAAAAEAASDKARARSRVNA